MSLRSKLGVNLKEVKCPECGTVQPKVRRPKNLRQAMWGGWTCPTCGCEMDKWGNKIESKNKS